MLPTITTCILYFVFFFFNDTATTEIYTLSLHDALPICVGARCRGGSGLGWQRRGHAGARDRKSTRLNSSHGSISYAVFCLKKKNKVWRDVSMSGGRVVFDGGRGAVIV